MPCVSAVEPRGAFYILVNIRQSGQKAMSLASYLLDEAKIAVVPWGDDHIRISYANSYEKLQTAMARMQSALNGLFPAVLY